MNPPDPASRRARANGFTLVELMVSVTVLGVLLGMAVPAFANLMAANRLTTQTSELLASLNLARSEAVRRAQPVTLRAASLDNYALGWTVFPDADADGAAASTPTDTDGEPVRATAAFKGSPTAKRVTRSGTAPAFTYTVSTDAARGSVIFTARGAITATTPAFFRLCDPTNPTINGRVVQVNVVGKVSVDSVSATCS